MEGGGGVCVAVACCLGCVCVAVACCLGGGRGVCGCSLLFGGVCVAVACCLGGEGCVWL